MSEKEIRTEAEKRIARIKRAYERGLVSQEEAETKITEIAYWAATQPTSEGNFQVCSTCGKKCRRTLNMCPTCYPTAK